MRSYCRIKSQIGDWPKTVLSGGPPMTLGNIREPGASMSCASTEKWSSPKPMRLEDIPRRQELLILADATLTPTQAITIAGTRFTVPVRYAEGHVLTAGEANALNQTYLENCRNNLSGRAKDGTLTQEIVDQYAACVGWRNLLRQRHLRLKGPGQKTGI